MSSLILPGAWAGYPDYNVGIDRSNPLGRTITNLIRFGAVNRDIVTNQPVTFGSGGTIEASQYGKVLNGTGSSARASVPLNLSAYDRATISFWLYWDVYANDDSMAIELTVNGGTTAGGFYIDPNSNTPTSGKFAVCVAPSAKIGGFTRPSSGWHYYTILMRRQAGGSSGIEAYVDGVSQAITYGLTNTPTGNFANSTLYFLSRAGTTLYGTGKLSDIVIRGGTLLSAVEAAEEYRNPWQIFQPLPRRIFSISSGGTSVAAAGALPTASLTAATGGATGSAAASGGIAAASLSAPTGSATGSATTSGSLQAISLSAPTGSAAAAGSAAADGALTVIGLTAPDATATVSIQAQAALAAIFLTPADGSATGSAVCDGSFAPISLTACRASASNGLEDVEFLRQMAFTRITEQRQFAKVNAQRPFVRRM